MMQRPWAACACETTASGQVLAGEYTTGTHALSTAKYNAARQRFRGVRLEVETGAGEHREVDEYDDEGGEIERGRDMRDVDARVCASEEGTFDERRQSQRAESPDEECEPPVLPAPQRITDQTCKCTADEEPEPRRTARLRQNVLPPEHENGSLVQNA